MKLVDNQLTRLQYPCWNTKTSLVNNVNKSLFHEMSPRSEVMDDSAEPGGTLRPNCPVTTIGTYFTPILW
jgi:hypothetical protein